MLLELLHKKLIEVIPAGFSLIAHFLFFLHPIGYPKELLSNSSSFPLLRNGLIRESFVFPFLKAAHSHCPISIFLLPLILDRSSSCST